MHNNYLCTYDLHGPVRNAFDGQHPLLGQVGEGWALEIESILGPVKWHRADRQVSFGPKKLEKPQYKHYTPPQVHTSLFKLVARLSPKRDKEKKKFCTLKRISPCTYNLQ